MFLASWPTLLSNFYISEKSVQGDRNTLNSVVENTGTNAQILALYIVGRCLMSVATWDGTCRSIQKYWFLLAVVISPFNIKHAVVLDPVLYDNLSSSWLTSLRLSQPVARWGRPMSAHISGYINVVVSGCSMPRLAWSCLSISLRHQPCVVAANKHTLEKVMWWFLPDKNPHKHSEHADIPSARDLLVLD